MLDDGIISVEEEVAIDTARSKLDLPSHLMQDEIRNGIILRHVFNGEVDELAAKVKIGGHLPFNLMKSEVLIWIGDDIRYGKTVTRREFVGGSQGVSVRVAKGVYVRKSAFRGRPVSKSELEFVDSGLLGVTTKHIYFNGSQERFRVRFDKVVSFDPYSDGVGFMRDGVRAKPEVFSGSDGWFLYNLLTNAAVL